VRDEIWCPDECTGGDAQYLMKVLPGAFREMTKADPPRVPDDAETWRCKYCGIVWYQPANRKPGWNATLLDALNTTAGPGWVKFTLPRKGKRWAP
jgi:hypothetical protein